MDKSIKDNITFNFKNEKIDSKFNKALVLSNLNDFIESLPPKENTKVGNDGSAFRWRKAKNSYSKGYIQRLQFNFHG